MRRWKTRLLYVLTIAVVASITFLLTDHGSIKTAPTNEVKSLSIDRRSVRWVRWFYDTFDVPHPLVFRLAGQRHNLNEKYVIYRCDTYTMRGCGGWEDRFRGMFTGFLVAALSGRIFKAEMLMPKCDLHKFIVPNRVNWSLPVSFHKKVVRSDSVKVLDKWPKKERHFKTINFNQHSSMESDFWYLNNNHDHTESFRDSKFYGKTFRWMRNQNIIILNRFLFGHLLRPSPYLQDKIISFLTQNVKLDEQLICLDLRMTHGPTIGGETRNSVDSTNFSKVSQFLREQLISNYNKAKIFVMSDSTETIKAMKDEAFGSKVFIAPGKIARVEKTKGTTDEQRCGDLERMIIEELITMQCDTLLVSKNRLSLIASYVRGRERTLYCFVENSVKKCVNSQLRGNFTNIIQNNVPKH